MEQKNVKNDDGERFLAALKFMSDKNGFDSKMLAELGGISKRMVDYIFARQRGGGRQTTASLSAVFGLNYAEMLFIGQLILEGVPGEEALELAKAGDKPFPAILSALDDPLFVSVPNTRRVGRRKKQPRMALTNSSRSRRSAPPGHSALGRPLFPAAIFLPCAAIH